MGTRCTDGCCRKFVLPFTPEELQEEARLEREERTRFGKDILIVAEMAIPLDRPEFCMDGVTPVDDAMARRFYTCKNFNTETNDCGIYETRPRMCRDYPYGDSCRVQGCEWEEVNNGRRRGLSVDVKALAKALAKEKGP